jgi:hypothetical protein
MLAFSYYDVSENFLRAIKISTNLKFDDLVINIPRVT